MYGSKNNLINEILEKSIAMMESVLTRGRLKTGLRMY